MNQELERLAILQQLGKTYRAWMSAFETEVGHCLPRWRILTQLRELSKPCAQKKLVERLGIDPGSLSRLLGALENQGLVSRSPSRKDNRYIDVVLTPSGQREVERCTPLRDHFIAKALDGIEDRDLLTFKSMLVVLEYGFSGSSLK
ncbi:MAG: MarR family transcriptional regulator [Pseudomonadota bacterium]|nr:MarR family transcriptional regulator [Pseudomonadota bacterium]